MSLVSIVIPVYNTEEYLEWCLLSLKEQSYKDIEVLVVDNKTEDHAMEIAERFAKQDSRFKTIYLTENRKVGAGRNAGLKECTGEYVMFLDSDDIYELNAVKTLYTKCEQDKADIAVGRMYWKDGTIIQPVKYIEWKFEYYKKNGIKNLRTLPGKYWLIGHACNRIYRRSLLVEHGLAFEEGIHWDDNIFTTMSWFYADKITWVDGVVYWRTNRKDKKNLSVTQTFALDYEVYYDRDKILTILYEFFMEHREIGLETADCLLRNVYLTTKTMLGSVSAENQQELSGWFDQHTKIYQQYVTSLKKNLI